MVLTGVCLLLFLAIALLIAGEVADKDTLTYVSALFWFIGGAYSLSQQSLSVLYVYIGGGALLIGLGVGITSGIGGVQRRREERAQYEEEHRPKTFEEELEGDRQSRVQAREARKVKREGGSLEREQRGAADRILND